MTHRHFTPGKANEILPQVKVAVLDLIKAQANVEALSAVQIEYDDQFEEAQHVVRMSKEFHRLQGEVQTCVQVLLEMGAFPKDIREGLVDFYAMHEGREIFLCWKVGEKQVDHWHEVDTGYGARRPVSELGLHHKSQS